MSARIERALKDPKSLFRLPDPLLDPPPLEPLQKRRRITASVAGTSDGTRIQGPNGSISSGPGSAEGSCGGHGVAGASGSHHSYSGGVEESPDEGLGGIGSGGDSGGDGDGDNERTQPYDPLSSRRLQECLGGLPDFNESKWLGDDDPYQQFLLLEADEPDHEGLTPAEVLNEEWERRVNDICELYTIPLFLKLFTNPISFQCTKRVYLKQILI